VLLENSREEYMAPFPQSFLDSVVAIGVDDDRKHRVWIGTGFIFGQLETHRHNAKQEGYRLWLVTSRHAMADHRTIYIKFNSADGKRSRDYSVPLIAKDGKSRWIGHQDPDIDVAAIFLSPGFLHAERSEFDFIKSNMDLMTMKQMKETNVTEGDQVFVLGFPMGMVDRSRQYVICRGGVVARVRDYVDGKAGDFLIDATIFPGNSGGPVILCPFLSDVEGIQKRGRARVVGMNKGVMTYENVGKSIETGKDLVYFHEKAALALVEPVDAIIETIQRAERKFRIQLAKIKPIASREVAAEDLEIHPESAISYPPPNSVPHRLTRRKKAVVRGSKKR
jgi:hypothetical protein